ncbi:MAG: hypothetical protein J07HX64_02180 [halophilic archaeon J07HX64]|jgi:hypothetical protein|nr:MAG: hypothetical protein J07HX64_02180 [halophilic archaeon J07HX64]
MNRRRFLTTAGLVGTLAVAGCVSSGDDDTTGAGTPPSERVDEPPHNPERPPEDDWDPNWLGAGMATDPSLSFETVDAPLTDHQLATGSPPSESEYAVSLLTSTAELESTVEMDDAPDRLRSVDFGEELVVVVESGYGSSSVDHVWQRVETVAGGIHLNGYRTDPQAGTTDYTARHSVLVVETTVEEGDRAHASLTVSGDERINFDSSEGVISLDRTDGGNGNTGGQRSSPPPEERIDRPPHDPERPAGDDWNPDWLGAGMATEPSLPFETVEAELAESALRAPPDAEFDPVYAARLLTSTEELQSTVDMSGAPDRLQSVDFGQELVVVVESGYGSSSVDHAWKRVEETDDGVYLNGYLTNPRPQTDDYTTQHSVVIVETPAAKAGRAHVSLTYSEDWRVNFDSTEGAVTTGSDDT